MMKKYKYLIISILISLGVGGLSALITGGDMDTYKYLSKPPLSPPSVLFPIVWTILFILMGISAYMVYVSKDRDKDSALTVYVIQLIVNFFWSIIFFSLKLRLFALIWIILLLVLIIIMIVKFYRISYKAGLLQIPYLIWTCFATYLTIAIYILNR